MKPHNDDVSAPAGVPHLQEWDERHEWRKENPHGQRGE